MFHHFHDDKLHLKSQGSLCADELISVINFIGRKNIINADDFYEKYTEGKLKSNEICFTFDDGIKSQIDVALPILEEMKIKSFFFVYSSIFTGQPSKLEVYRHFRTVSFNSVNDFYEIFYKELNQDLNSFFKHKKNFIIQRKKICPYYSTEDVKFRLVRDHFLSKKNYDSIMDKIMKKKNYTPQDFYKNLFFDKINLTQLNSLGHQIGLHSHSHPTLLEKLPLEDQEKEYRQCLKIIANILKRNKNQIKFMSHPNGSYNVNTLNLLKKLGLEMGFKPIMQSESHRGMKKVNNSSLEIARQDHADIMSRIQQ